MQFGDLSLDLIGGAVFRIDGGAMFGVVPRALWQRQIEPDAVNRIPIATKCLLIRTSDGRATVLVDTGIGDLAANARFRRLYGVTDPPDRLDRGLTRLGVGAESVTHVVLTHLHFDHVGGACLDAPGSPPRFPNARYLINRGELEVARAPDERSAPSYRPETWEPLERAGVLQAVSDDHEVIPGVVLHPAPGHTDHHQVLVIRSEGRVACFLADLIPTPAHLKPNWVMGFDLDPRRAMAEKRRILDVARRENWLLVFEHAADLDGGYLSDTGIEPVSLSI